MSDIKLTMLVNSINKLVSGISQNSESQIPTKDITSYIVGVVLGSLAKLPSEKPSNMKIYYTAEVLPSIHAVVNSIIENVIMNMDVLMDTIYKTWCHRYELLYPNIFNVKPILRYLESTNGQDPVYSVVGNSEHSDALSETINNFAVYLETLGVNK